MLTSIRSIYRLIITGCVFAVFLSSGLHAQSVTKLTWPTRNAAPPASATPEVAPYLPMLRASVGRLPESALVNLALSQSSVFGMSGADADKLSELVARRYAAIAASPVFKNVPSTLDYCLSETRPRQGLALLYQPRQSNAQTPVILFLHGYGGSFIWYQHQLAEWFPDHIILCPSYGIDPSEISAAYLRECLAAAAVRFKHPLAKPSLVGLSAGGFGATRVYAANPAGYQQLVVMAAYPPDDAYRAWPKTARAGFLVGAQEYYVKDGGFAAYSKSLTARSARYQGVVIAGADHFFLLTHPADSKKTLRTWLAPAVN
ncbi:alpha/beta fold hydrolase [Rariglobus hedericola]|uniref:Alpha/beta hydrolase n=1 Tax=Rariglobus hedericola TaxID=2597822 RepID=A0A556QKL7_9BACT|nr:alpha/beta hydrolase [Rariglobus hedericola]TSJ77193.1 alpha/beta hydrolase [Rariglobus hedericola]